MYLVRTESCVHKISQKIATLYERNHSYIHIVNSSVIKGVEYKCESEIRVSHGAEKSS